MIKELGSFAAPVIHSKSPFLTIKLVHEYTLRFTIVLISKALAAAQH